MLWPDITDAGLAAGGIGSALGALGWQTAVELRPGRPSLEPIVPLDGGHPLYRELLYRPQRPWRTMPNAAGHGWRWQRWYRELLRRGVLRRLLDETGPVAINLNSAQASDERLVRGLLELLEAGYAGRLWIEWTEYEVGSALEAANNLRRLRLAGARIVLDDAGAGVDWEVRAALCAPTLIKLDGALLQAAALDAGGREWQAARHIVRAARRRYRAFCTAEWVETAAHRETARQLGCAYGQGRYFMREVRA